MPVIRSKYQSSQTLEEFYDFLVSQSEGWKNTKDNMLNLINKLNEEFPNKVFYALTSHSRLVILKNEDPSSEWLVIFSSSGTNKYQLDAILPNNKSIWQNARIITKVEGTDKAIDYFKLALKNLETDKPE